MGLVLSSEKKQQKMNTKLRFEQDGCRDHRIYAPGQWGLVEIEAENGKRILPSGRIYNDKAECSFCPQIPFRL